MTSKKTESRVKLLRDDEVENERCIKAKRHDIDISPTADVDAKLAEKLDSLLRIHVPHKSRFKTNKPRSDESPSVSNKIVIGEKNTLKHRDLTKEELRERLLKKYDTLVPELDPKRTKVKVVEILSANESIELGREQARKQLQRELEIGSVSGNRSAYKTGLKAFKFNDGYGSTMKNFATKNINQNQLATSGLSSALKISPSGTSKASKSVAFAENVSQQKDPGDDDESDYDDDYDDSTESDCSTTDD